MLRRYLSLLLGCLLSLNVSAAIETQIDKNSVASDEMFTLIISSHDHLNLSPDLEPLKKDFYIAGTSQNSSFSIVNGSATMETQWQISLIAKHPGDIQIPELLVGKEKTQPQVIHVAASSSNTNMLPVTHNNDIFIETSVTPKESFIQEQFIYTVKLYFSRTIGNAFLMAPELPDAKVIQNGQDIVYSVTKKGRYFRVLERTYLITPEKTGHFEITPPILKGYLETSSDQYDIYGMSSHAVKPIKVVGPVQVVTVKPKPAGFAGHWLPARKIEMHESWDPSPPVFREGEPVNRIIDVTAIGATGDQIPNLVATTMTGLNSYVQPAQRQTDTSNGQQVGKVSQRIVYIPTHEGKLTLPAIQIKWWNSITQKEQTTTIPAKTITVLPALMKTKSAAKQNATVNQPVQSVHTQVKDKEQVVTRPNAHNSLWAAIAVIAVLLWLTTLLLWRRQTKKSYQPREKSQPNSRKTLLAQLKEQTLQNNPVTTRELLLNWAQTQWKAETIHSLADIVAILEREQAEQFSLEIMQLEANFYADHHEQWQGAIFWNTLNDYLKQKQSTQKNQADPLPPLYCTER